MQREPPVEPAPITPEILAELLRVQAPAGIVRIQGIARELRSWGSGERSQVYGRLTLGVASVRFRTPLECAPQEDEAVIIEGTLRIEPATRSGEDWRATHQVMLVGGVIGQWEPRTRQQPLIELVPRDERLSLDEYVRANNVADLVILVSGTARADIVRTLSEAKVSVRPRFIEANFGDPGRFLATLHDLRSRKDVAGLAIARGGGGGQELIGGSREIIRHLTELKLPFYVALGHATDLALIDKYADQSFHAPSGLGAAIGHAIRTMARLRKQEREFEESAKRAKQLDEHLQEIQRQLQRSAYFHRTGVSLSWPVLTTLSLIVVAFVWVLR